VNSYAFVFIKLIRNTIYLQTEVFETLRGGKPCRMTAMFWDYSRETLPGHGNNAWTDAEMKMPQHEKVIV
jgi:hypothetical protein